MDTTRSQAPLSPALPPSLRLDAARPAVHRGPRSLDEREALESLGEEIAELATRIDTVTHRLLTRLRTFDEEGGWEAQGARTSAHWLSWRTGMDMGAARERVRVARALGTLPLIDDALRDGKISFAKARAITRVATPATETVLLEHAQHATASRLERICRGMRFAIANEDPRRDIDRYLRHWTTDSGMVRIEVQLPADEGAIVLKALEAARFEVAPSQATFQEPFPKTSLDSPQETVPAPSPFFDPLSETPPGHEAAMPTHEPAAASPEGGVSAETRAAGIGVVGRMLPNHHLVREDPPDVDWDAPEEDSFYGADTWQQEVSPTWEVVVGDWDQSFQKATLTEMTRVRPAAARADALLLLAERYLDERAATSPASPRYEITVIVDQQALAGTGDGAAVLDDEIGVAAETARRISCDAPRVEVLVDSDGNALDVGRRTRSIPPAMRRALALRDRGCRFPTCTNRLFVDGHHIRHWAQGGETRLDNLVMVCRRHHRAVHEEGFRVEMKDGQPVFYDRFGGPIAEQPSAPSDVCADTFVDWFEESIRPDGFTVPDGAPLDPLDLSATIGGLVDLHLGAADRHTNTDAGPHPGGPAS